jgi:hypothetical protein
LIRANIFYSYIEWLQNYITGFIKLLFSVS